MFLNKRCKDFLVKADIVSSIIIEIRTIQEESVEAKLLTHVK